MLLPIATAALIAGHYVFWSSMRFAIEAGCDARTTVEE